MRILNYFKLIAALAVMGLVIVACQPDTPETPDNPNNTEQPGDDDTNDDPNNGEEPNPEASFSITVEEVHASKAITQVTPKDVDMYYVMFFDEVFGRMTLRHSSEVRWLTT